MDEREEYQDGDINDPIRPPEDFAANAEGPTDYEEINVEEELVQPMHNLSSQERTPTNSQQQTARSIRYQG